MDANPRDISLAAVNALILADQDRLFTLAGLLLGDDREAEDAARQACEGAYQRLVRSGPSPFRETLYACLVAVCERRSRSVLPHFRRAQPRGCLDGLPFRSKAALALVELAGFSYAEASRILGCSPQDVCRSVAAGRRALAKYFRRERIE
jgi:DNA-directed RNA polymerase specialized sigma24 family protein